MTSIELLSPARNIDCGMAAIDHGADAVYIGASRFGARAAAGNSVEDIARLCQYAHQFKVRVYVTVNTILYDSELEATRQLVWELYHAGVDALIVQDTALLKMELPPIPLHASTQMDNRTVQQAQWLQSQGYKQIVLARELSLEQIKAIHQAIPDTPLEAFVHGALCVSYSGKCYASQYCFNRSANRGECAQFCRLPFTLKDANGVVVQKDKYLLSLRDMNRSRFLEQMMDAGVRSFKIEGRLKDVSYVKNVTAYYRQAIDAILKHRPEYARASIGTEQISFQPDPSRSFSRGFTSYFLTGRTSDLASPDTPKSRGQEVGFVKEIRRDHIVVSGTASFANGDGLCYMDSERHLQGFRVNRVEGNHLFPAEMPTIKKGDIVWRNFDQQWERMMSKETAVRRIPITLRLSETVCGFQLTMTRQDGEQKTMKFDCEHQLARTDQTDSIRDVLTKLGDTIYTCSQVEIQFSQPWFIPRSLLTNWRRAITLQDTTRENALCEASHRPFSHVKSAFFTRELCDYSYNISNRLARRFYKEQGAQDIEPAFELQNSHPTGAVLMTCRFCLRYQMGWCPKNQQAHSPYKEPYYLESLDGRRFRLDFDCRNCEMKVVNA